MKGGTPVSEKTRRALQNLGLTEYEVKAYTALLEHEVRTASQISRHSGIPFSKIYEVLGSLERKGWVEAEHARPSKYFPKPPSIALETTRLRMESELRGNERQVLEELKPLYEMKGARERPEIWIVRGEYNVLSKIYETLVKSQRELLIALPFVSADVVEFMSPRIIELSQRGVSIMVMMTKIVEERVLRKLSGFAEVRVRDQMFGGGVISDEREVVLLLGEEKEGRASLAIWSDHVGLTKFAKNYFEYLWNSPDTRVIES